MPPKTILFAMLNESGHLNPTFKLAKALRARGHDVRYLAVADVAPLIEAQGFSVEVLLPELFPKGFLAEEQRLGALAQRRRITARYRSLLERLRAGAPFDLARVRPDLLLVDVTQPHFALWARRQGGPFLHLNTALPQTKDVGVPPLRSGASYGARGLARLRAELAWTSFLGKRRVSAALARPLGATPPYELARRAARAFGLQAAELDWRTTYMPQLRAVPELVLCPEAFDFPRAPRSDRHYIASIDLERQESALDPALVEGDDPLVYCAFGGQKYRVDDKAVFFRRLVDVMRTHPKLRLLLATGKHIAPSELGDLPANVRVVEIVPQLAVLKHAQLMITHAGLGSVKECIMHAVPMLAVPLAIDQPGNAARIVHHGLGLRADVRETREAALSDLLDLLVRAKSFRAQARAMQARFQTVERGMRGVELVEAALSTRAAPRGASQPG